MGDGNIPELDDAAEDMAVSACRTALKTAASILPIPVLGPLLAEVIGNMVPDLRAPRLEAYVRLLGERLCNLEEQMVRDKLKDPEYLDVFEEGAWQSARATSAERAAYIASLVAHGLSGDDQARIESKRLLSLLREIDDAEVIILAGQLVKYEHDEDWHNRHGAVLFAMPPNHGSPPEAHDRFAIHSAAKHHLIRLGLLKPCFRTSTKGKMPEFDPETGMLKAQGAEVSRLGLMLLRHIGLAEANDF